MDVKFNCNNFVRVKLTEFGYNMLKKRHDDLNRKITENGGKGLGDFRLDIDDKGYYRAQFWMLMGDLGEYFRAGRNLPFSMDVIIEDVEEVEVSE